MSSQGNSNFLITLCLIDCSDLMNIDFFLSEIFHGHLRAFECICSKTRTGNLRDYSVFVYIYSKGTNSKLLLLKMSIWFNCSSVECPKCVQLHN